MGKKGTNFHCTIKRDRRNFFVTNPTQNESWVAKKYFAEQKNPREQYLVCEARRWSKKIWGLSESYWWSTNNKYITVKNRTLRKYSMNPVSILSEYLFKNNYKNTYDEKVIKNAIIYADEIISEIDYSAIERRVLKQAREEWEKEEREKRLELLKLEEELLNTKSKIAILRKELNMGNLPIMSAVIQGKNENFPFFNFSDYNAMVEPSGKIIILPPEMEIEIIPSATMPKDNITRKLKI